jgi:hypothetical protein
MNIIDAFTKIGGLNIVNSNFGNIYLIVFLQNYNLYFIIPYLKYFKLIIKYY